MEIKQNNISQFSDDARDAAIKIPVNVFIHVKASPKTILEMRKAYHHHARQLYYRNVTKQKQKNFPARVSEPFHVGCFFLSGREGRKEMAPKLFDTMCPVGFDCMYKSQQNSIPGNEAKEP